MVLRMSSPWKHPKTGNYYFRRRVPADLVDLVDKKEVKLSLGTKDPATAKRLFAEEWHRVELEWAQLRRKPEPVSLKTIMALAGEVYSKFVAQMDQQPGETAIWDAVLRVNESTLKAGALEQWYGPTADESLLKSGIKADQQSRERLLVEIHNALQQAANVNRRKSEGDYSPDNRADRFPPLPNQLPEKNKAGLSLFDLYERWLKNHEFDGRSAKTAADWKRTVTEFVEYIGHSDAKRIQRADVIAWREHLKYEKELSSKTINGKKLAALRSIYAVGIGAMLVDKDPTEGTTEKIKKPNSERPKGFTQNEADKILKATLNADETAGNMKPRTKLALRWLPWLCAYTGARAGEITQLRKEDVRGDDIPSIYITPEAGTVKTGQYREVPLHPHLIELGFLDFVASRPAGPLFFRNGDGTASNVRAKVGDWVRKEVGIKDKRIQPNHAWRHRFKTMCREAGIHREYADAIQGHTDTSASAGYGEMTMKTLFREIKKLPRYEVG